MDCIGDWVITQKTYTTNAFPFTRQYDHGDADQYYTESTHPAIITKETFEKAQELRQRRAWLGHEPSMAYPLTLKNVCGKCGYRFDRRRTKKGLVSWVCSKHDDHAADCPMGRIPETEIYSAFVRMFNKLKQHEAIILKPALAQLDDLNVALQRDDPAMRPSPTPPSRATRSPSSRPVGRWMRTPVRPNSRPSRPKSLDCVENADVC